MSEKEKIRDRRVVNQNRLPQAAIFVGLLTVIIGLLSVGVAETAQYPMIIGAFGLVTFVLGAATNPQLVYSMFSSRSFVYSSVAVYQIVLVLGILFCVNFYADKHPFTKDMTEVGIHTLADQTKKVFANLPDKVKAVAFFQTADESNGAKPKMRDLLTRCERVAKGKFSYEFIDPDKRPSIAAKYKVNRGRTTVFIRGKNETKISEISEEAIVNAIIKITRTEKKRVYLLAGHGEADMKAGSPDGFKLAADDMRANQYDVQELHLYREKKVPEDADVVILAGPQKGLFDNEVEMLANYLKQGGKFVALIDPYIDSKLDVLLEEWGVILGNDTVVDVNPMARMAGGGDAVMPLITMYGRHEITAKFRTVTMFPLVRSAAPNKKIKGLTASPLLLTTQQSWAEKNRNKIQFTPGVDKRGPICIGTAVRKKHDKSNIETRMVVIGDSDFASNRYYNQMANGNLFQNAVNWSAKETDLVSIKAKTLKSTPLRLSQKDLLVTGGICLFYSAFFLLAGGVIWFIRRGM
mgnify:FL=1